MGKTEDGLETTRRLMAALMQMKPRRQAEMRVRKVVRKRSKVLRPDVSDLADLPDLNWIKDRGRQKK